MYTLLWPKTYNVHYCLIFIILKRFSRREWRICDTGLLAKPAEELQHLLNNLNAYCNQYVIKISFMKTWYTMYSVRIIITNQIPIGIYCVQAEKVIISEELKIHT